MLLIVFILYSIEKNLNKIFFERFLRLRIINSFEMKFDNFKSILSF